MPSRFSLYQTLNVFQSFHGSSGFLPASSYRRNRQLLLDYRQPITLFEKLAVSDRNYKLIWLKVIVCFIAASQGMLFSIMRARNKNYRRYKRVPVTILCYRKFIEYYQIKKYFWQADFRIALYY